FYTQALLRPGQTFGLTGEIIGSADIAGQIAQVARVIHAFGDGAAERKPAGGAVQLSLAAAEYNFGGCKSVFCRFAFELITAIASERQRLGYLPRLPFAVAHRDGNVAQTKHQLFAWCRF